MHSAKAVNATAHQLARPIHVMLTRGEDYVEPDITPMETERRERTIMCLQRQTTHCSLALLLADQAARGVSSMHVFAGCQLCQKINEVVRSPRTVAS